MSSILTETIVPWILGTLLLLILITLTITVKSWREMKRSPYFFLRRQAEKRLQTYSLTSLGLILATLATAAYSWQTPLDMTPRVAILANGKPVRDEIRALVNSSPSAANTVTEAAPATAPFASTALLLNEAAGAHEPHSLPEEYNQVRSQVDLKSETKIGSLAFSTDISEKYEALNPRAIFAEGFYTLYATFSYEGMADGMAWSWVWRHNGKVVDGGNHLWRYGDNGPGYIFLSPPEGFQFGEYSLEVWVNEELLSQSAVTMNNAAISAGN